MFLNLTGAVVALGASAALGLAGPSALPAAAPTATASPAAVSSAMSTAEVAPAAQLTSDSRTVGAPAIELAACRRVWHPGQWYRFDRGGWDRFHHWQHGWERRQHPGRWGCR
jgi:hypothetical protein